MLRRSVGQNLTFPLELLKIEKSEIERRMTDWLRRIELKDALDGSAIRIFGGEQQDLTLALALIRDLGQARRLASDVIPLLNGAVQNQAATDIFFIKTKTNEVLAFINGDIIDMIRTLATVLMLVGLKPEAETMRPAVRTSFNNSELSDVLLPAIWANKGFEVQLLMSGHRYGSQPEYSRHFWR